MSLRFKAKDPWHSVKKRVQWMSQMKSYHCITLEHRIKRTIKYKQRTKWYLNGILKKNYKEGMEINGLVKKNTRKQWY